jgi:hypothetical protein
LSISVVTVKLNAFGDAAKSYMHSGSLYLWLLKETSESDAAEQWVICG